MTARDKAAEKAANVSQPKDYKLVIEKDVKIPLRDGAVLYADIFRPESGTERFPAIMNISVYQKDKLWIPPAAKTGMPDPGIMDALAPQTK